MSIETASKSLTSAEAEAVLLVRGGRSRASAAEETGLTVEQVGAALERADSHRAQRVVPASVPPPRRPAPEQAQASARPEPEGIEALLNWAERTDMPRAQTLASRARAIVDELLDLHKRGEKIRVAQKTIKVLEQQLLRARADLRDASRTTKPKDVPPVPDDAGSREERDRVRAWARENGHVVAERGKIPDPVMAAYRAAVEPSLSGG